MAHDLWTPELLTAHNEETQKIIDKFKKEFNKPDPHIVYHYSQIDKLNSILQTNAFWASNIKKLKDPSEYAYGISLVTDLINEKRKTSIYDHTFIDLLLKKINDYETFADNLFIVSFSLNGDSLPLWQSYSDVDLTGYNLGFYYKDFDFSYKHCHGKVIYSVDEQKRILFELIDEFDAYYKKTEKIIDTSNFHNLVNRWHWDELISYFTLFKDKAFACEEEFRVVHYLTSSKKHHIKGMNTNKPYIEIPTCCNEEDRSDLPLWEIGIGPKNKISDNEVKSLFPKEKLQYVDINRSKIRLR